MARSHVIESLQFDVAFDSADEAFAQQARLGSFANGLALEVIERVFDELAPAGRVWRLDRLDVQIPPLPAGEPDSTWAEWLETGLREALGQGAALVSGGAAGPGVRPAGRRLAMAAGGQASMSSVPSVSALGLPDVGSSGSLPASPSASCSGSQSWWQSRSQSRSKSRSVSAMSQELEPLWYWLHHGHLPWHADGRPTDAVRALWHRATPEQRQVLQLAVRHSPQRATLQLRWASQGLAEGPAPEWVAGAEQRSALRHHDPGPATWAVWMESLSASQRRQLCRQWVPAPQVDLVEALAESVPWRAATQALLPGRGEAQCRSALWGCAMGAVLHLGDEGFDAARWVSLMLQRWGALVTTGRCWTVLACELDMATSAACLPAAAWRALRDGVAALCETAPLRPAAARPAAGRFTPVSKGGLTSTGASTSTSEASPVLLERAGHAERASQFESTGASPALLAKGASHQPRGEPGTALPREPDATSPAARRERPDPAPSAEALAAWQQVTQDLDLRSEGHRAEASTTTALPAGPCAAARRQLEPALAGADLREATAAWAVAVRGDRRWLAARLRQHGRRHAWRRALARSLDGAQFESLLRLWAGESDTRRVLALLSTADRWSLGSLRQPPSWRGLLHEWLVDHLLVGPAAAFELRSCVAHLLQQRERWDGRPAHEVVRALRGAVGEPAAPGLDVDVGADVGVLASRPDGPAVKELPLAVRHLVEAATPRLDRQAMGAAPAVAATPAVPASPADAAPTRAAEVSPVAAARPAALGASIDAMRARLDAALAQVDPSSAGDEWSRGCREDRAWLAARLRHHGRSANWRAAWAAHPDVPWLEQLGLWPSPAEVDTDTDVDTPSGSSSDTDTETAPGTVNATGTGTGTGTEAEAEAEAEADIVARWPALLSDVASTLSPPSAPTPPLTLQHLAQRDRLAALLASPDAAARQVDLLDEAGRRQLLRCLRPDAAALALATLDLLVQARAEASTSVALATPRPTADLARDDWRFVLRELVEEDRPFEPAGFARRWWAFFNAVGPAPSAAAQPSGTAPATASALRPPSREAVAEALGRQVAAGLVGALQGTVDDGVGEAAAGVATPSASSPLSSVASPAARVVLARRLHAGLVASSGEIDDFEPVEDVDRLDGVDSANALPPTGEPVPDEPEAFLPSFTPPWPDAPRATESPPWIGFVAPAAPAPDTTMYVHNAGLVLLGPYLPMLFSRLGLTEDQAFKDEAAAERALHLLQFLCDGSLQPGEHQLLLPKLLCGLDLALPVVRQLVLHDDERAACTSLLEAVIAHWRALGKTSVAGLQETFLQREGALTLIDDEWSLTVESKAFDILIDQLPWGFSTCRFPWMNKVLHVHWR